MVADMRSRISLFVVWLTRLSSKESKAAMLIGYMGIARLMIHVQQVEKDQLKDREEFENKKAKTLGNKFGQQKSNANRSYFQHKQKGPVSSSASALAPRNKYRQVRKLRTKEVASVKVLWRNQFIEEATWEAEKDMKKRYPHLFESREVLNQEVNVALTQSDSEAIIMEQLTEDARDFLNSKRVAKKVIKKRVGNQNVVQQLARNYSSLATVDGVSKLHGICINEFWIDTLVDSTPKSTLIGEEAVKEGVDHQVIPEASILPNENFA
ncbi:hypothetical protein MTR67_038427 [Solanum verrucosum]|uniref:Chromo domain-containing protein n=1 Tax=Solanum verrucosum TaxID=315347 RepID=A0AAF0UFG6_SOLVR|nr:hypothetical protein MTR67_038427 [Solanum verrucosum]